MAIQVVVSSIALLIFLIIFYFLDSEKREKFVQFCSYDIRLHQPCLYLQQTYYVHRHIQDLVVKRQ